MATTISLVCWGGKDGRTVTLSAANDDVTYTNHGLYNGTGVQFTAGTMPTGAVIDGGSVTFQKNYTYYARSTAANTFQLYDTPGHAIAGGSTGKLTWTGSGTGPFTLKSAAYMGLSDKSRWTYGGTEYIFDGLKAARDARNAATGVYDVEIIEMLEGYTEGTTTGFALNLPCLVTTVTPTVNGAKTSAHHGGVFGAGYCLKRTGSSSFNALDLTGFRTTISGVTIDITGGDYCLGVNISNSFNTLKNCFVNCGTMGATSQQHAVYVAGYANQVLNNTIIGCSLRGLDLAQFYGNGSMIANNLVVKSLVGICGSNGGTTALSGWVYNNMAIGNTTDWDASPAATLHGAANNMGPPGSSPWYKGTDTSIKKLYTGHFVDYANNDFRPAPLGNKWTSTTSITPTISIASPCVVTITGHGCSNGAGIIFTTTGALPTGIVAGTKYYIRSIDADTFNIYDTAAHAIAGGSTGQINTSGTQSGTHNCSGSPQIDSGLTVPGVTAEDINGDIRPNYNNGGATAWDVGPYEYNNGYGLAPEVHSLDLSGIVAGSQVVVYFDGTTTELTGGRNDSLSGSTFSVDAGTPGVTVAFTVMKMGYDPIRVTGLALVATSTAVTIQQKANRAWVASSGLTYGTDLLYAAGTPSTIKLRVASTLQNAACCLYEAFIASSTNTALKNIAFPISAFGDASFTLINGAEWRGWTTAGTAISNTSLALLSRDGLRYSSDDGTTTTAQWAAILTLDTPAGTQIKYRQTTGGAIVAAQNTGPMDQLVQVYGNASYGNFDYRDHMVLRAPRPGYSQPKPDLVATYGNLSDGFFVSAMAPALQYSVTNADIDAAHLALDNSAKTYTVTASHTMMEAYQRAQWWCNQDAQWDADIPIVTTDGSTFTQPAAWSLIGAAYLTGGTLAGGSATLAAGTQGIAFNGVVLNLGAEGTYTFTMAGSCTVYVTPTADNVHYIFGSGTFNGTLTVRNTTAHPVTIEVPTGTTTSSSGNTGGAITFSAPAVYQSVTITGGVAGTRLQLWDSTHSVELYNGVPGAWPYTWTDPTPVASSRAIRMRAAYVSGVTAKLFRDENIGTCATSGAGKDIGYLLNQSDDAVYNANAISGATVTGITITPSPARVLIAIAGGAVSWKQIYAYQCYWLSTATGIADEAAFISAPDTANYRFNGFDIKNTSSPSVPLVISGGYGVDATSGLSADLIDTTGGTIILAPDHVVAYAVSGSAVITGDIANVGNYVPTAASIAAATLSAAQSAPIYSDARKIKGQVVVGSGSTADPWGPA